MYSAELVDSRHQLPSVIANDLSAVLRDHSVAKTSGAVCIVADNGPDWSLKSLLTTMAMGRLWRDMDLDILILCSYAPRHSAHNMIEHARSPLSRYLVGVTLSITLPGEDKPPCQQSDLAESEREAKESTLFDNAIKELNGYWEDCCYDSFPIYPHGVLCSQSEFPYDDHESIHRFLHAGIRETESNEKFQQYQKELQFISRHATRDVCYLQLCRCSSDDCDHCSSRPVREPALMELIRTSGGRVFVPTPSKRHPGHYLTWLECQHCTEAGSNTMSHW